MLIPNKTEHDVQHQFLIDPLSAAVVFSLALLFVVIKEKLIKP